MRSAKPERLSEREIGRLLLKLYEVNGWPIPDQPQDKNERRSEAPASNPTSARNAHD